MNFGKYDQKIQFIKYERVSDGAGGSSPVETVVLTTFASMNQLKVSSNIEQAQMNLPIMFRVRVMVRKGFIPVAGMMVKWRGKMYEISNAPQVENVRLDKEWIFDITTSSNG